MKPRPTAEETARRYRTEYLRMKSVLYDRVTSLPALPVLFAGLRRLLEDRREIGVLHVEVSDLDMVESLYGWQVFDDIVANVARTLNASLGRQLPSSALIAVNGVAGHRFVVFVPEQDDGSPPDASVLTRYGQLLCEKLEQAFDEEAFAGLSPTLCFRVGQAFLSENPFHRFERCVYSAVNQARGEHERRERLREHSWGEELRTIIRTGLVNTVFQPVVDLRTHEVLGHEAFSRGPQNTLFETPRSMFALSERLGLAHELDRLCSRSAVGAATALPPGGKLFVNVRRESLDERDGVRSELLASLELVDARPSDVVLEVSERDAGNEPEPFVRCLRSLKESGYALALDDVGTGRAGLAAIEQVGPDYLKVDTSLVRDIHENLLQRELLATLVELADKVGGVVIGEGIENEAEAATLIAEGARFGQGHLFAAPSAPRSTQGS